MAYALALGSYNFPRGAFYVETDDSGSAVPVAKSPRAHGAVLPIGYLHEKRFQLRGGFFGVGHVLSNTGGLSVRAAIDNLNAALNAGKQVFTTDSDRYYRQVQKVGYPRTYEPTGFNRFVGVEFELFSEDPFAYDLAGSTATQALSASGQTITITPGGSAQALPALSVTAATTHALSATIVNAANGDTCTLIGSVTAGDVLVVDSLLQKVTRSGVNETSFFDGMWVRLEPGIANVLTISWTAGSLNNIAAAWNSRWW